MIHILTLAAGITIGLAYHFANLYHRAIMDVRRAVALHLDEHAREHDSQE